MTLKMHLYNKASIIIAVLSFVSFIFLLINLEVPDATWAPLLRCFIRVVQIFCFNGAHLASQDDECYEFNGLLSCR